MAAECIPISLQVTSKRLAAALILLTSAGLANASEPINDPPQPREAAQREADAEVLAYFMSVNEQATAPEATPVSASLTDLMTVGIAHAHEPPPVEGEQLLHQPVQGSATGKVRYRKVKLIRYNKTLNFGEGKQVLKVRAPGKRKSIMSLELNF